MKPLNKIIQIARENGMFYLVKSLYRFLYHRGPLPLGVLEFPLAVHAIKNLKSTNIDDILNFVYTFRVFELNIKPMQVREEIRELLNILSSHRPRRILEIGTANGGTLFLFCRVASDDATIISIDLPGGPFGGGYPKWKIPLYKSFAKDGQKLYLIRADSHNPKTLELVKKKF